MGMFGLVCGHGEVGLWFWFWLLRISSCLPGPGMLSSVVVICERALEDATEIF